MLKLSPRTVIATGLVAVVGIAVPTTLASSNAQPANKAVAAASKTEVIAPNDSATLMTATFKTSKPEDLIMTVSAECSILTDVVIEGGPDVSTETATAEGTIKVWLEIDDKIVPLQSVSTPPQNPTSPGDDTDKITFCDRLHERTVTDNEEDEDGLDGSEDYQRTKSANAFTWVLLNAGSGEHTVAVKATLTTSADEGSSAEAVVGNRTLVIEPTKLANNAVISDNGTG